MLLSFERPPRQPAGCHLSADLENCTAANDTGITGREPQGSLPDHRQDSKGTWWMPWHQESKKGVNGCDKPRLGAEWPVTRGFPNGETRRR